MKRWDQVSNEYRLTNSAAARLDEDELFLKLKDCFTQSNHCAPSEDETKGLREAAEWIKGNVAQWRVFERGIQEGTWDPARGARSVFSDG